MTDAGQPDHGDPGRELENTNEFDVPAELASQGPLFRDDLNGHAGNFLDDDCDPWFGRVVRRDPEF